MFRGGIRRADIALGPPLLEGLPGFYHGFLAFRRGGYGDVGPRSHLPWIFARIHAVCRRIYLLIVDLDTGHYHYSPFWTGSPTLLGRWTARTRFFHWFTESTVTPRCHLVPQRRCGPTPVCCPAAEFPTVPRSYLNPSIVLPGHPLFLLGCCAILQWTYLYCYCLLNYTFTRPDVYADAPGPHHAPHVLLQTAT